jgi:hypothetical protein
VNWSFSQAVLEFERSPRKSEILGGDSYARFGSKGGLRVVSEKPMFWSGSYALISIGAQAPLDKLSEYVQNPEKPE